MISQIHFWDLSWHCNSLCVLRVTSLTCPSIPGWDDQRGGKMLSHAQGAPQTGTHGFYTQCASPHSTNTIPTRCWALEHTGRALSIPERHSSPCRALESNLSPFPCRGLGAPERSSTGTAAQQNLLRSHPRQSEQHPLEPRGSKADTASPQSWRHILFRLSY